MQKKFTKDIEIIKDEEMNKANNEMESMRTICIEREQKSAEDVKKSEGLYVDR